MSSPSNAITRLDLSLSFSEFNAALNRKKFIGHLVFPPLSVGVQNNTFRKIKAEHLMPPIEDTKRAPKGTYKRDDFEWGTDSYATDEHGVEEPTDDRQLKMYPEVTAEAINRDRCVTRIAQAYENTAATLAFDTAYFTGSYTQALSSATNGFAGVKWNVPATAKPIEDMDAARKLFKTNSGHSPNALAIAEESLLYILRSAEVMDVIRYSGQLDSLVVQKLIPQLAEVFRLEKIVVADSPMKNTAGHGAAATFTRIWGSDKALLFRYDDGPDLENPEPSLGRTIMWSEESGPLPGSDGEGMGVLVEEYREEQRRGGIIRGRTDYVIKRLHKPAGLLLTALE